MALFAWPVWPRHVESPFVANESASQYVGMDLTATAQPSDTTCGPASLHAVYRFYGLDVPMAQLAEQVPQLPGGGTLAVHLALDAMARGFDATIYTCNLQVFDPTWFHADSPPLAQRLRTQMRYKRDRKMRMASRAYLAFDESGGRLMMCEITFDLILEHLRRGMPLIAGLSSTWLYQCARDRPWDNEPDDVAGEPSGHFVVIHGADTASRRLSIADPYLHEPFPGSRAYTMDADRVIHAILLGIMTYDAKMLLIHPRNVRQTKSSSAVQRRHIADQ